MEPGAHIERQGGAPAQRPATIAAMAVAIAEDLRDLAARRDPPTPALRRQSRLLGDLASELALTMGGDIIPDGLQRPLTGTSGAPSAVLLSVRAAQHASENLARRVAELTLTSACPTPSDAQQASALTFHLQRLTAQIALSQT